MHTIYERLIHWAFSARRFRMLWPPLPAYGHPFDAAGPARQGCAAPPAPGDHHAARRDPGRRRRELRRRARARAAGRQRVHPADRPELHPAEHPHAGRRQPGAQRREGAPGGGDRRLLSRGEERLDQRRRRGLGLVGRAQPGVAEHRPRRPRASASARRRRWKTRSAQQIAQDPRHRRLGRFRPADLRGHPRQRPGACWRKLSQELRRQDQEDPGHRPTSSCRTSPACRPSRCA